MKVGSILENHNLEKRIAITPDIVKKYISLGFEILLSKNYGSHLDVNRNFYLKVFQNRVIYIFLQYQVLLLFSFLNYDFLI